jgi:hypothetical protein
LQKQILPRIEKVLQKMRSVELGLGTQKYVAKVIEKLVKAGDMEAPADDDPAAASKLVFAPPSDRVANSETAAIVGGKVAEMAAGAADVNRQAGDGQGDLQDVLELHIGSFSEDIRSFCNSIASAVVLGGRKKKLAGTKIVSNFEEALKMVLELHVPDNEHASKELPAVSEEVARGALGDAFDSMTGGAAGDEEMLLYVVNLLLMYGAGHLLLKDATLKMR